MLSAFCSVMSDSLQPHGLYPTRLLCPWDFPSKNTEVGCQCFLQVTFLMQGLMPMSLVNSALTGVLFTAVSLEKHSKKLPDTIYLIFYA